MKTRYFQHLNPSDDNFQKVTILTDIDDTDPSFVLYYFEDGTKCNKEFIGDLNEQNVFGKKELVEVSSPANIWSFNLKQEKQQTQSKIKNANGEWVDVPTEEQWFSGDKEHFGNGSKAKNEFQKYEVVKKPAIVNETTFNFNENKNIQETFKKEIIMETNESIKIENEEPLVMVTPKNCIDFDALSKNCEIAFTKDGEKFKMTKESLIEQLFKKPEEKIIIKEVEKEYPKEVDDTIELNINKEQQNLIDTMINMSAKEECDIEMCLTLNLPPTSVYELIKTVYPEGLSNGFVISIANKLGVVQLKKAVVQGLLAYYNSNNIEIVEDKKEVDDNIEQIETKEEIKPKARRGKQSTSKSK